MALIKTLAEIKEVLPKLVSQLSNTSLLPNFDRAEYKYIVPVTGETMYNTLVTAYNASTLDPDETILVKKLRLPIAAYAFKDELGLANLTIGDTGARKLTQGGSDRVFGWEYNELKNTLLNAANDGLDVTLSYLFKNKLLFPEWTASSEYSKISKLLIKTGTEFDEYYKLFQSSRTYFLLRNVLYDTQLMVVDKTIGKDLLDYFLTTDPLTDEEQACLELLKKALAFFTVAQGCKHFSVSFTENGYTLLGDKSGGNETQTNQDIDIKLLDLKMSECERQGNDYMMRANYEMVKLYNDAGAEADYKTALAEGPLSSYIQPEDVTSGNELRKIFVL